MPFHFANFQREYSDADAKYTCDTIVFCIALNIRFEPFCNKTKQTKPNLIEYMWV